MGSKYDVMLDTLPADENRIEILFRQAVDGFLQVEYGRQQRAFLADSFRILTIDRKIKQNGFKGLIETVPALRTNLFHYDPETSSYKDLIKVIKKVEESVKDINDIVLKSRLIHLPIVFEDSETRKTVEKYQKEVRPDSPHITNGSNLEYIAQYNGVTKEEAKRMILETQWYNSGGGFWPGGGFFWPMDPRCLLVVPKYNPPRTWTQEGAVGIGGPCIFTYTTPTGGGYQLFGTTIPVFQFSQKHPMFKDSPFLYRDADRIKFHEVSEEEIKEIHHLVHKKGEYEYQIEDGEIVVKDWLDFFNSDEVQKGIKELQAKQEEGMRTAPQL